MSVLELKGNILQLLARLENRSHLEKLQALATQFVQEEELAKAKKKLRPAQQTDFIEVITETTDSEFKKQNPTRGKTSLRENA